MSNVIKSRYVYANHDDKKVIDSNGKSEMIRLIHFSRHLDELSSKNEVSVTEGTEGIEGKESKDGENFTEGLAATVIETVLSEKEEEFLQQQRIKIISDAQKQAALILEKAALEAKESSELLYEQTHLKAYEDGMLKSISEIEQTKQDLEELVQKQKKDYLEQIETLEPHFANIVSMLIEKLTGIVVEDKKEVLQYLIHNAMINAENSKSYLIKVSKDDYEFVVSKKEKLFIYASGDIAIDVVSDKNLAKNQCLIVTDTRIIDCSLDVQLSKLIQDIKLLSNQKE